MAFSCKELVSPSLRKILEAQDKKIIPERAYTLEYLAMQGVLLLNTILTVEEGKPLSHKGRGWEQFTRLCVEKLTSEKEHLVIMAWGKNAMEYVTSIRNKLNHLILYAEHPVAAAYRNTKWNNQDCFNKCNTYLQSYGQNPIKW